MMSFWDSFAAGYIKGHAFALFVIAVIAPPLIAIHLDWWLGVLFLSVSWVFINLGRWMWRRANRLLNL